MKARVVPLYNGEAVVHMQYVEPVPVAVVRDGGAYIAHRQRRDSAAKAPHDPQSRSVGVLNQTPRAAFPLRHALCRSSVGLRDGVAAARHARLLSRSSRSGRRKCAGVEEEVDVHPP